MHGLLANYIDIKTFRHVGFSVDRALFFTRRSLVIKLARLGIELGSSLRG